MPTTASADRASTALEELTEALKNPAVAKPFLNTGNKLNAAIEALTEILSKSKSTNAPKSEEKISPPRVSERTTTVRTPVPPPKVNTAQAGSPGLPLVPSDPKLPVRGLNEIFNMREPVILNSIKKTTSTPTKSVNKNNINDNNSNNSINGVDTGTPGEKNSGENSGENSPNRRLRKRIIPKPQKLKLNTTVYKIFEDNIHTGYICEFDPRDGFYKIQYQDGDIEEGTDEENS
jgi:hypothetical protein